MCGIVGILGQHEVAPILVDALKRLEYRGYDSAGIATLQNGSLDRRRAVGKLVELSDLLVHNPLAGKIGIGHTRWATHGEPNEKNAHPHKCGPVAVVHNGIVENFRELREELAERGLTPESDTDTETVAMLIATYLDDGVSPVDAAKKAIERLHGAFALAIIFDGEDDLMIAARQGSPLAIGYGSDEMYIGSDAIALAPMTNKLSYLEEGDFAVLTRSSVSIWDKTGTQVQRDIRTLRGGNNRYDKDGFQHFMEKEIHEQPNVISEAIDHYLTSDNQPCLPVGELDFNKIDRLTMVACGTAFYACFTAKYWFERLAGIPVDVDVASEFRYREPPITKGTVALFVSQSGETADTLAALRYCAGKADQILSVTNVAESSIARESDLALPIYAGVEIGVASTKAFTCQLAVLLALALKAAQQRGTLSQDELLEITHDFRNLPMVLNAALDQKDKFEKVSRKLAEARDILFLGRGVMYPLAHEGALKLKEVSYIHAEAYASGELKHGPIALVDAKVPVVVMAPKDGLFDKTISNVQEVMARKGKIVLLSDAQGLSDAGPDIWRSVEMPKTHEVLNPILYSIPAQLLAYYTAIAKGTDVDQPRNLAKSVTVE